MLIVIAPDGTLQMIYEDDLAELLSAGPFETERASHVEPAEGGGWSATMVTSGKVLGPFSLRREALAAEAQDLEAVLTSGKPQPTVLAAS